MQALLALAAGFGHAMAHILVFSLAWLPLASGTGVLHIRHCSAMSWAPAAAFTTLGIFLLHTGSMVVALDGLSAGNWQAAWAVGAVHFLSSLLTLANLVADACAVVAGTELVVGAGMIVVAAFVFRRQIVCCTTYAPIANEDDAQ